MKSFPKITLLSLRTYPTWWQERYREEMDAVVDGLLEEGRSSARISFSLLGGSLRTRLLGTGAPASRELWSRRTQTALLVATLPWFAMIPLVGIFSANGGEYALSHGNTNLQLSGAGVLARNLGSIVFDLIIVSFFIVLFGWSRLRGALKERGKGTWLPRASLAAAVAGVALILVVLPLGYSSATASPCVHIVGSASPFHCATVAHGLTVAQFVALTGLGLVIVAFVLAPFVIARAVRNSELPVESLHSGSRVATALSALFVGMTLTVSAYGIAASLQPIPQKGTSYMMERSALGGWFVLLGVAFAAMAVLSSLGTFSARRSYRRTVALEG
jgi:hypothetical protein